MGSGTTALAAFAAATLLTLAAAGMPDSAPVLDPNAVPPKGQEIPGLDDVPAHRPDIEEVGRTNVSLLTFGIARIEARLERLSRKHSAEFRIAYDAGERRIRISVLSYKMKTTDENCRKLIGIVKKDAGFSDYRWNHGSPTDYAHYFVNASAGEFAAANIDSRFDIEVTINNSFEAGEGGGLSVTDRISCKGGFAPEH
jgi:hypothetical protein